MKQPQNSMSPTFRKELDEYLSKLEASFFAGDPNHFDKRVSTLIDCIHYLLQEGGNHAG